MYKKNLFLLYISLILSQLLVNCGSSNSPSQTSTANSAGNQKIIQKVLFSPLTLSKNTEEIKTIRVSSQLTLQYTDGTQEVFPLSYKTLAKMGDKFANETLGLIKDKNKNPIVKPDGTKYISNHPDGNSLLLVGGKSYLITNMEALPGSIYQTQLIIENNELKVKNTKAIDFSSIHGTIINCASSKTNYATHLGGEENFALNTIFTDDKSPFYIDCSIETNKQIPTCLYTTGISTYLNDDNTSYSPYNYGRIVEVSPQSNGTSKSTKHYVTGRFTPELAIMMPDNKTLYMSDDGNATALWKFVSLEKIDSFKEDWEGTLYAAKLKQKSANNGGDFSIEWIELGKSSDAVIKRLITQNNPTLSHIFDIKKPDAIGSCILGYTKIVEAGQIECLKLKDGKEKEAAFLESRKYAAYKGATIEFNKAEGLTYNPDSKELYLAITSIDESMLKRDDSDHIKLNKNSCGAVYTLKLNQDYDATSMKAIVKGKLLDGNADSTQEHTCSPDLIANPDNIKYLGHNILLIGEDTPFHLNNMLWSYHTKDKTLTRIASLPIGSEVTGIDKGIVKNKGILMMNIQHPFKDTPKALDGSSVHSELIENASENDKKAIIGYIDGIPTNVLK